MKKHTKLIAIILTLALAITSVSLGNSTTVHAADATYVLVRTKDNTDVENTTVTMKPGDNMSIRYMHVKNSFKMNLTHLYTWECSDQSVITLSRKYSENGGGVRV